jgi:putative PIN family toxin of toxin-antitoxin system
MPNDRYFLDANILISGIIWNGNERKLLVLGENRKLTLVTSMYVFREIQDVFEDFEFSSQKIAESLVYLRSFMDLVDATEAEVELCWDRLDDKGDVPVLAAAIKSKCTLVTGDKKLANKGKEYLPVKTTKEILDSVK